MDSSDCNLCGINFLEFHEHRKQTTAAVADHNLLQHSASIYFDQPEHSLCYSLLALVHSKRVYCIELRICALYQNQYKGGLTW